MNISKLIIEDKVTLSHVMLHGGFHLPYILEQWLEDFGCIPSKGQG
jgi:hypothetical protein